MLELAEAGGGYRVERYAIAQLPKDVISDGSIARPEVVQTALQEAWTALGSKSRDIVMALPSSAVISKRIVVPSNLGEVELDVLITNEANQSVSFPVDEIRMDYHVLGASAKNPSENEALLVITRRERVEERVAIAEAVGLKAAIMDVDNLAALAAYGQLASQLPGKGDKQTVALIDIGANFTHINIFHSNHPVFQRTHAFGGYILTKEIARHFGLSIEEAEDAKRKGQLPAGYEQEVLPNFLDAVAQEISNALKLFFSSTSFQGIDQILLAGGCALLPGVADVVRNRTQTQTSVANPFTRMAVSSHINAQRLTADAPLLYVACGLALRRFDPA